jgi:hypothetical protein
MFGEGSAFSDCAKAIGNVGKAIISVIATVVVSAWGILNYLATSNDKANNKGWVAYIWWQDDYIQIGGTFFGSDGTASLNGFVDFKTGQFSINGEIVFKFDVPSSKGEDKKTTEPPKTEPTTTTTPGQTSEGDDTDSKSKESNDKDKRTDSKDGLFDKTHAPDVNNLKEMSALEGLEHYLGGSGKSADIPFSQIDTSGVTPEQFNKVKDRLSSTKDGAYNISDKLAFPTTDFNSKALLGNITLQLDGTLTLKDGSYTFKGNLSALPDKYDFNPSTHRTWLGEMSTTVGRSLPGTPYMINIIGNREINSYGGRQ